ncbi:MAG: hypothetical protein GF411_08450, partial [Candidatus Lokiarchaeota archaeon]|nr:hypothetical protein [Candidatus Lokiarchaeota archaeon]
MKWESNPDFGNYRSEISDSIVEKRIFENLISRDPYLVLEKIKTSPEPWWGISHLSKSKIADDAQAHEVIKGTAETIAIGMSSSDLYWEILQKIKYYSWLFDNEFIVKVISEKIRTSNSPVLLQQIQPYFDRLIKHNSVRNALLHYLETSDYPQAVFELVENHPSFYTEQDTISTIESVIKTSESPWHLIK